MGSRTLAAFGNETYKLNLANYNYKYDSHTRNLVGRSFVRCLRNRMLLIPRYVEMWLFKQSFYAMCAIEQG
jgi:hypothetical protein